MGTYGDGPAIFLSGTGHPIETLGRVIQGRWAPRPSEVRFKRPKSQVAHSRPQAHGLPLWQMLLRPGQRLPRCEPQAVGRGRVVCPHRRGHLGVGGRYSQCRASTIPPQSSSSAHPCPRLSATSVPAVTRVAAQTVPPFLSRDRELPQPALPGGPLLSCRDSQPQALPIWDL